MGRTNKTLRFSQNKQSPNLIESGKGVYENIKGKWKHYFKNSGEIVLELACGWGEYSVALAEKFRDKNFVGVDLKGDRIWKGSQYAIHNKLNNVAFLRVNIIEICNLFTKDEIDEIWLICPDPKPKDRDEKHRLTNALFLEKYRHVLKKDGWFRFKTDNTDLFEYTLKTSKELNLKNLQYTYDLYDSAMLEEHHGIKTKYEKKWVNKGEKIKYMKFQFASR